MKKLNRIMGVSALLFAIVFAASSCKKNTDAVAIITVMQDSLNFVTGDTELVPAVQATVRFYSDQIEAEHIDTTILTNTNGKAEFTWFEDAILKYDVIFHSFTNLENYVILEQGETQESTIIITD